MFWMLAMTLWLPYLDEAKSYRAMIQSLQTKLPATDRCVASRRLGLPQRALLQYFAGLRTERLERKATHHCDYLLVQSTQSKPSVEDSRDWKQVWEGSRPGDTVERYQLYRRKGVR